MAVLLVVDDEVKLRELLREYLGKAGYTVRTADCGALALAELDRAQVDLIILDWMLPDMEGLQVAQKVRQQGKTPIIMLTARSEETDRVVGLEMGADDYVTKPFSPRELLARVKAVLRRTSESEIPTKQLAAGPFVLNEAAHSLKLNGKSIELTATEFTLVAYLLKHPNRVFSRLDLLHAVEGSTYGAFPRTIDTHIKNLRRKLESDPQEPQYLITVHGVGYKLAIGTGDF